MIPIQILLCIHPFPFGATAARPFYVAEHTFSYVQLIQHLHDLITDKSAGFPNTNFLYYSKTVTRIILY